MSQMLRICLVGPRNSGKSAFLQYHLTGIYTDRQEPTMSVSASSQVSFNGMNFLIYDTPGKQDISHECYSDARVFFFFVDVSNPQSMKSIKWWIKELSGLNKQDKKIMIA